MSTTKKYFTKRTGYTRNNDATGVVVRLAVPTYNADVQTDNGYQLHPLSLSDAKELLNSLSSSIKEVESLNFLEESPKNLVVNRYGDGMEAFMKKHGSK